MNIAASIFSKNWKSFITAILVFITSACILLIFKKDIGGKTFFMLACLVASYYSYHHLNKEGWKQISRGILLGLATLMFTILIIQTINAASSNAQWDFMCFYLYGLLGVHKLNFYDPNSFNILLESIDFQYAYDNGFKGEILDVGFLYPPITMLLFAPLAFFDYETSRIILSVLIFIFIIANTILANFVFVKTKRSIYSFLFIFILIMLLPGTNETLFYNQTNFFLLFFLILTMDNINKPAAGIYLALSIIVKPISGILILFFIFNKKWKSVIYFFGTGIVLLIITGIIWGFHNIIGFFESPPTQRLPQWFYIQTINQSLIGVLDRNLKDYGLTQNMINLLYYLGIVILAGLTFVASNKLSKINTHLSFLPFILCMLMVYPSSLTHYMVYISPLLIYFLFLKQGEKYFWVMLLPAVSFLRTEVFFTYLILWIVLLGIGLFYKKTNNIKERFRPGLT